METARRGGKVTLVTSAGSGIGLATVRRLADEGATVVGCDINADAVEAARDAVPNGGLGGGASGLAYTASVKGP